MKCNYVVAVLGLILYLPPVMAESGASELNDGQPWIAIKYSDTFAGEAGRAGALACLRSGAGIDVRQLVIDGEGRDVFAMELHDGRGHVVMSHKGRKGVCKFARNAGDTALSMMQRIVVAL